MSQANSPKIVNENDTPVEVVIPPAVLKLRDKFQALGYRTTFGLYHVEPLKRKVVNTEYLSDMPAVYHVHGGTIVFEPRAEDISAATLYHPLSAAPVIMHFYTETGEFRSACMCGQLEGVETIPATSFEDVFADFPADTALWGEEEKQKELLTLRRPKADFKLVEKPISREEMLAQWQAQQEALQVAANEEQLEDQSTGEKLETTGLPTYDENNEDADLGKIADEREGQACTRVDVESL